MIPPTRTAVLVIDMINEYLMPEGKLFSEPCRVVIEPIANLLQYARQRNWAVFFVNTVLTRIETPLAQKWGVHAEPNTWGSQIIAELDPQPDDNLVNKQSYDGFYMTELDGQLRHNGVSRVIICGIHTHVCVLLTAVGAFQRGYDVIVLEDCITTTDPINHVSRLPFFESHIGVLTTSQALLQQ